MAKLIEELIVMRRWETAVAIIILGLKSGSGVPGKKKTRQLVLSQLGSPVTFSTDQQFLHIEVSSRGKAFIK